MNDASRTHLDVAQRGARERADVEVRMHFLTYALRAIAKEARARGDFWAAEQIRNALTAL